jgi:hypothetical protein
LDRQRQLVVSRTLDFVAQLQKIGMTPPPGKDSIETALDCRPG